MTNHIKLMEEHFWYNLFLLGVFYNKASELHTHYDKHRDRQQPLMH